MPEDTSPKETASEGENTLGDLVTALREALKHPDDPDLGGADFWIDEQQREAGSGWDQIMQWPLDEENVMGLVQLLVIEITYEVQGMVKQESYDDTLKRGHAFLRLVHAKAAELGIDIPLAQFDIPLSPSDAVVQSGLFEEVEGGRTDGRRTCDSTASQGHN